MKDDLVVDNEEIIIVFEVDGVDEFEKFVEIVVEIIGVEELEKYIGDWEVFFKVVKEWDVKMRDFEVVICRFYFYVRLLDDV